MLFHIYIGLNGLNSKKGGKEGNRRIKSESESERCFRF